MADVLQHGIEGSSLLSIASRCARELGDSWMSKFVTLEMGGVGRWLIPSNVSFSFCDGFL